MVPKLKSSPDFNPVKSKPDSDSPSGLTYPSDSSSRDSSPLYAKSIGVTLASPSPATEPQPGPAPAPLPTPPFDPFDYLSWQTDNSTLPSSASKMPSEPTQTYRSIHERSQTPGPLGPQPDTAPPASVWDDETVSETPEQVERRATVDEVYEFLCALCAEWRTTAPVTVHATVARSADYLRLGIFLGIVVSDEGHIDFLEQTIPGAHGLLTMISTGVTTTMTSTETENNDGPTGAEVTDLDDLVPMFVGIPDHEAQEVTLPDGHVIHVVRMGSAT
uniref:Uncharacterized protein n=1 Tax=Moniliophthora roreri TaxID=221103 RepID=A0A0W0F640_MONRR